MRLLKIIFIYSLLIIYSLEILLFFSIPKEQKSMVKIKQERVRIAKSKNLTYDLRSPDQFYLEEKKKEKSLEPKFLYAKTFNSFKTFKEAKKNNSIIPFRGPINKKSISCAEDLTYRLYENDKYGFKNSNEIYNKKINSFLLGDSYAEGLCVLRDEDIAGNLNKKNINTVNFGVTGTGPLISLAILKEFGKHLKPKNIIYLYFEGNDLEDLKFEKNEKNLLKYLDTDHSVNYIDKYEEIKSFLEKAKIESEQKLVGIKEFQNDKIKDDIKENIKAHLKDIAELNNLKNILRYSILKQQEENYDFELFYSVIKKMDFHAKDLKAKYYFVYVPSWSRYFTKYTNVDALINLKDKIIKDLKKENIEIIDLTEFFDKTEDIKQYYPLGYVGHFNAKGYAKISDIIANKLR